MSKIDDLVVRRLRGLCDLALDERTPEKERVTSAFMLAKEVRKIFFSDEALAEPEPEPDPEPQVVRVKVVVDPVPAKPPEGWDGFGARRAVNVFGDEDAYTIDRKRRRR